MDAVRVPQQALGFFQAIHIQGIAYPGTADTLAINSHCAGVLHRKAPLLPHALQQLEVASLIATEAEVVAHHQVANAQDRKSTRLNSSHVRISYAVFCLKKKIKT